MTLFNAIAAVAGLTVVGFGLASLWPRRRWKASAENNWQQRDGTEIFSEDSSGTPPPYGQSAAGGNF